MYFWKTPDKESDLQQELHGKSSALGTDFRAVFDFLSQTKRSFSGNRATLSDFSLVSYVDIIEQNRPLFLSKVLLVPQYWEKMLFLSVSARRDNIWVILTTLLFGGLLISFHMLARSA